MPLLASLMQNEVYIVLKKLFGRQPSGLINYYGLSGWYTALSSEQQSKIKHYYALGMNTDPKSVDSGNVSSSASSQNFLSAIGMNATSHKDYQIAEIVLSKALEVPDGNPIDLHFVYNGFIELYYKQRDNRSDAIDLCVHYCLRDINSIQQFILLWHQQEKQLGIPDNKIATPRIPSFERLAIIYEKQGKIQEAIEICKKATNLNLHDSTKGGFPERLARLEKKNRN